MMNDARLFRRSDPDFPTTRIARNGLIAAGRVVGEGPDAPGPEHRPPTPQHGGSGWAIQPHSIEPAPAASAGLPGAHEGLHATLFDGLGPARNRL